MKMNTSIPPETTTADPSTKNSTPISTAGQISDTSYTQKRSFSDIAKQSTILTMGSITSGATVDQGDAPPNNKNAITQSAKQNFGAIDQAEVQAADAISGIANGAPTKPSDNITNTNTITAGSETKVKKKKKKRRVFSCDNCRKLKTKCAFKPESQSCDRCHRLRLDCSLSHTVNSAALNSNNNNNPNINSPSSDLPTNVPNIHSSLNNSSSISFDADQVTGH
ncbi:unnamed protein product [Ambrosiozyma monospora]|uniref:Unnamed protein product n=1 Tax=Ambrosiozyma monospora TaxID=43982 RepID=A0ACB5T3Y5_AMBMO|nr:unnamed protein product [Ambrosiozyma monospora]